MESINLPNIGIIVTSVDATLMQAIGAEIDKIQSDFSKATPTNHTLAGNILREYKLNDCRSAIEIKALEMAQMHQTVYGANYNSSMLAGSYDNNQPPPDLKLAGCWVNFQKKHEFNPIHNHSGLYSFVLWYKIPYFANIEEFSSPGRKSSGNRAGKFEFSFTNILGNISGSILDIDKTYEGQMCLFPAMLNHQVYPFFSSNDYRISVSGNLFCVPRESK